MKTWFINYFLFFCRVGGNFFKSHSTLHTPLFTLLMCFPVAAQELERFTFHSVEMAVPVSVTLYAEDEAVAKEAAEAAFLRFRDLNARLSDYAPESELRQFCDHAQVGEFRTVSEDLWNVLAESVRVAKLSDGAFDPTVGQVVKLWRRARGVKKLPAEKDIARALETVGYENLLLDTESRSVALAIPGGERGVRIDLGGIAKGYAIDEAIKAVGTHGIARVLVDAGGDIGVGAPPPGRDAWIIEVISPGNADPAAEKRFIHVSHCGLANSGDLSQFLEADGKRYSHLVDPKTGVGLTHRATVSVIAPTAMEADALASAVSVLGKQRGLEMIEKLPGVETQMLMPTEDGEVVAAESSGWGAFVVRSL